MCVALSLVVVFFVHGRARHRNPTHVICLHAIHEVECVRTWLCLICTDRFVREEVMLVEGSAEVHSSSSYGCIRRCPETRANLGIFAAHVLNWDILGVSGSVEVDALKALQNWRPSRPKASL